MSTFFQAGVLIGFLQGIYDGDVTFEQLAKKGDFGLGAVNGVDGEMVAVDGIFYRIDAEGNAAPISPHTYTNFSVVSTFQTVQPILLQNINSLADMNKALDQHIISPNLFYMIRIEVELEWIHLRSECPQPRPYRPLAETLPELERNFKLQPSKGTLVVSRCPHYSMAFNVPGYHYHYINTEKTTGGHVADFKIKTAQVMINPLYHFEMVLFNTPEFANIHLDVDIEDALKKVE